jgi:hypothetical protein
VRCEKSNPESDDLHHQRVENTGTNEIMKTIVAKQMDL